MKHELIRSVRSLGGRRKGTNAACTCQQWHGLFTNDKTPEQARQAHWGEESHAEHVASTTVESDIEALKALIARTQRLLTDDIEHGYTSFIEGRMRRLNRLVAELVADMERQASGELAEMVEEKAAWDPDESLRKFDKAMAEHQAWLDENPGADGMV